MAVFFLLFFGVGGIVTRCLLSLCHGSGSLVILNRNVALIGRNLYASIDVSHLKFGP